MTGLREHLAQCSEFHDFMQHLSNKMFCQVLSWKSCALLSFVNSWGRSTDQNVLNLLKWLLFFLSSIVLCSAFVARRKVAALWHQIPCVSSVSTTTILWDGPMMSWSPGWEYSRNHHKSAWVWFCTPWRVVREYLFPLQCCSINWFRVCLWCYHWSRQCATI